MSRSSPHLCFFWRKAGFTWWCKYVKVAANQILLERKENISHALLLKFKSKHCKLFNGISVNLWATSRRCIVFLPQDIFSDFARVINWSIRSQTALKEKKAVSLQACTALCCLFGPIKTALKIQRQVYNRSAILLPELSRLASHYLETLPERAAWHTHTHTRNNVLRAHSHRFKSCLKCSKNVQCQQWRRWLGSMCADGREWVRRGSPSMEQNFSLLLSACMCVFFCFLMTSTDTLSICHFLLKNTQRVTDALKQCCWDYCIKVILKLLIMDYSFNGNLITLSTFLIAFVKKTKQQLPCHLEWTLIKCKFCNSKYCLCLTRMKVLCYNKLTCNTGTFCTAHNVKIIRSTVVKKIIT